MPLFEPAGGTSADDQTAAEVTYAPSGLMVATNVQAALDELEAEKAAVHSHPYESSGAVATHAGAADPHTGYQRESEKGAASGYCELDSGILVPVARLGSGAADSTKFLRGDRVWATPPAGGSSGIAGVLSNATLAAEQLVSRFTLAANELAAGTMYNLWVAGQAGGNATEIWRMRIGPLGTTADALICTLATTAAGVANAWARMLGQIWCITSGITGTCSGYGQTQLANAVVGNATAAFAAATVNTTVQNYLSVTVQQSAAQTFTTRMGTATKVI